MKHAREAAPWVAIALVVWAGGLALQRLRRTSASEAQAPWQRSFRELPEAEQRTFRQLRESLAELERVRAETGAWPLPEVMQAAGIEPFREDELTPHRSWSVRRQGPYATYVGIPRGSELRWLILFIEPSTTETAPPEDEEHHTLPNGMPIHVTVWSHDNSSAQVGDEVLAFPAAEGWVQLSGR